MLFVGGRSRRSVCHRRPSPGPRMRENSWPDRWRRGPPSKGKREIVKDSSGGEAEFFVCWKSAAARARFSTVAVVGHDREDAIIDGAGFLFPAQSCLLGGILLGGAGSVGWVQAFGYRELVGWIAAPGLALGFSGCCATALRQSRKAAAPDKNNTA